MQIPIISGIYADQNSDWRTGYPMNMIPVPKGQGISGGYLRPGEGLIQIATGSGVDRGSFFHKGLMYRVSGEKLIKVMPDLSVVELGDIAGYGQASMTESFDQLAIASGSNLYYWDGMELTKVTDPDLGSVVDVVWVDGYFVTTDGEFLVVTELNDPTAVNPLKYGSSEANPDQIVAVLKVRNELTAVNRYSIETFENVGGNGFPFQRIDGAFISRGAIGTHACCVFEDRIAFVGGGINDGKVEPPSVYLGGNGSSSPIATREIETILQGYTEEQLSGLVIEPRTDKGHRQVLIHLPDRTLVYDAAATQIVGEPVWFVLSSGILEASQYLARNISWAYGKWIAGDPTSSRICELVMNRSDHYGQKVGWEFSTAVIYNEGNDAEIHDLELVCTPGRVQLGIDPTIWTSYSVDGETWSQERPISAGKQGDRQKRLCWRRQGRIRHYRMQKFRGTSDTHVSFARLEAKLEALFTV